MTIMACIGRTIMHYLSLMLMSALKVRLFIEKAIFFSIMLMVSPIELITASVLAH